MTELLTAARMRAIEQAAIASGAVTGLELMERAGQGVVDAMLAKWPALATGTHAAVVLCGPGNNGGDGFVVARLLLDKGWDVQVRTDAWEVFLDPAALAGKPGDAWTNARRWHDMGGRTGPYADFGPDLCKEGRVVVVDALLGIGQTRNADAILAPFRREWDLMCNLSPRNEVHLVSVDVPTGYDSDTGAPLASTPFDPDLCVTFHARKPVHPVLEDQGIKVVVIDIGLSPAGRHERGSR